MASSHPSNQSKAVRSVSQATLICKRGAAGAVAFAGAIPDSLDAGEAEVDERADGVADDFRAFERMGQRFNGVFRFDDFVGGRFQADNALRHQLLRGIVLLGPFRRGRKELP